MILDRARLLRDKAFTGSIIELEVLAETADYAASFGYSSLEIANILGSIFGGMQTGTFSLLEGIFEGTIGKMFGHREPIAIDLPPGQPPFGVLNNDGQIVNPNNVSGFHPNFDDHRNQLYHFIPYVMTMANGGDTVGGILGLAGNYGHEYVGIPDFGLGSSWQDSNLAYAGMVLGYMINHGLIQPDEIGNWLRNTLSTPVTFDNARDPDDFLWIQFCRLLGRSCNPSVPRS